MKKILFIMGVTALAMTSCSNEEVLNVNPARTDANPVSFRVRSSKHSRSMEYSTGNLEKFMVFGFKGWPEDNYEEGKDLIPYFEGGNPLLFSSNGSGLFTSNPAYYYPVDGSYLYFSAYAPTTLNMQSIAYGGTQLTNFTVDADITKQLDIICANGGSNLEKDEPDQELTFQHAMTKVFISRIMNSDTRYKYEIAGIKIGNISNTGNFIYRGEKSLTQDPDLVNGYFDEEGYLNDPVGNGFYWKTTTAQTDEMVYLFDTPLVLDSETETVYPMTGNDTGAEDNIGNADGAGKGGFMLIPQKLSSNYVNEDGVIDGNFGAGMSYIAFLVRITYVPTNEVIYPYATGVENISKTIGEGDDAVTYAWAAFPVSSLWRPGTYTDYAVTLTNGAGYVAPGADSEIEFTPILGREIKFTEEVQFWPEFTDSSIDHNSETDADGANTEDPDWF
ncbi:MAG: fimbrillin family protein [Muribaculaceae bacterium]|nr:fimbrillin family protein [Muribaculaceae bacterium]